MIGNDDEEIMTNDNLERTLSSLLRNEAYDFVLGFHFNFCC